MHKQGKTDYSAEKGKCLDIIIITAPQKSKAATIVLLQQPDLHVFY
jgi:hypothetical protein